MGSEQSEAQENTTDTLVYEEHIKNEFECVPGCPEDPIFAIKARCKNDEFAQKVDLTAGIYKTNEGNTLILPTVQRVRKELIDENSDLNYLGIAGNEDFIREAMKVAYGDDCEKLASGCIQGVQCLSGMGGLRLGMEMVKSYFPEGTALYTSDPTWGPHIRLPKELGIPHMEYRYYDAENICVDFEAMCEDLRNAKRGSVILIQPCAHNPTGCDPTNEQWDAILQIMIDGGLFPLFDMAYQGFATSDFDDDAYCVRKWVAMGKNCFLGQSFAKNMGMYGYRLGCFSFVCQSKEEASKVKSTVKKHCRLLWSNPPKLGSQIAYRIMSNQENRDSWYKDVFGMADRVQEMREALVKELKLAGSTLDWSHVTKQIGIFSYTGLNSEQITRCIDDHHVYLLASGRISVAGLNTSNVAYVAQAFHAVTST